MKRGLHSIKLLLLMILFLSLAGCGSVRLYVVKAIPTPQTQPIKLTLAVAPDVNMPKDAVDSFRTLITTSLSEKGFQFGSGNALALAGTVTAYDPGSRFARWVHPGYRVGIFHSKWVVENQDGSELAKAIIVGSVYAGVFGGSFEDVLRDTAERVADFLTGRIQEQES